MLEEVKVSILDDIIEMLIDTGDREYASFRSSVLAHGTVDSIRVYRDQEKQLADCKNRF